MTTSVIMVTAIITVTLTPTVPQSTLQASHPTEPHGSGDSTGGKRAHEVGVSSLLYLVLSASSLCPTLNRSLMALWTGP